MSPATRRYGAGYMRTMPELCDTCRGCRQISRAGMSPPITRPFNTHENEFRADLNTDSSQSHSARASRLPIQSSAATWAFPSNAKTAYEHSKIAKFFQTKRDQISEKEPYLPEEYFPKIFLKFTEKENLHILAKFDPEFSKIYRNISPEVPS